MIDRYGALELSRSTSYLGPMDGKRSQGGLRSAGGEAAGRAGMRTDPARSALMARVRQKGTTPELAVREILKRHGHRFSTNARGLPGSPDIVDRNRKLAVFVHGCFWHRHARCAACTTPKRNAAFWQEKFEQNMVRDAKNNRELRRLGFRVLTIWECQLKSATKLARLETRLDRFFANEW